MMEAIGTALTGYRGASEHFNQATRRIAEGQIEAETIVDSKVAELEVKAQLANLKAALEIEDSVLNILA